MSSIKLTWEDFKGILDGQSLSFQYFEIRNTYCLYCANGPIVIKCLIYKDNSADQTDFETNYKSKGNSDIKAMVLTEPKNISTTLYKAVPVTEVAAGELKAIDLKLVAVASETKQILYGGALYANTPDFGDYVKFQVVDVDNIIGYGAGLVLNEYIVKAYLNNNGTFEDYDEAGAYIPVGLYLRCLYKSEKSTGTTQVKINYLLGIP